MEYTVKTLRKAQLEARWSRTRSGAPILLARNPVATLIHQRKTWWAVDHKMWETMKQVGVLEGFERHTLLGDVFSLPT